MQRIVMLLLAALAAGCSSVKMPDLSLPQGKPSDAAVERYGRYCEQLGNLRDTPEFDRCVNKQEDMYK